MPELHCLRIVSLSRRSTAEDQLALSALGTHFGAGSSWENRFQSLQDLDLRERLTAETDLARDTLGSKKRAAREA